MSHFNHSTTKPIPSPAPGDIERFLSKTKRVGACLIWQDVPRGLGNGYGVFKIQHEDYSAHRVAYAWFVGNPDGVCVCHNCPGGDNSLCVEPTHLFTGTHQDNVDDKVAKGRAHGGRGERNNHAKLTEAKVIEIRELCALRQLTHDEIAARYMVARTDVSQIARGTIWKQVGGPRTFLAETRPIRTNTGLRGISRMKKNGQYQIYIDHKGIRHSMGWARSIPEAIEIYNSAAIQILGDDARLNRIDDLA